MKTEWLGWLSSLILIATLFAQVKKQWAEQTSKGISKWLFFGQILAGAGFIAYSALVHNWVFCFTNSVLLLINLVGLAVLIKHRGWRKVFTAD